MHSKSALHNQTNLYRNAVKKKKVKISHSYEQKDNESDGESSPLRNRRRSRIHERDKLFKEVEKRIHDIRRTTDLYMKEKSRDFFKKLHLSLRIDEKTEPPSPNKSHNGTVTSMSPLPILKNRYASQNKSFKVNQKSIGSISASKN